MNHAPIMNDELATEMRRLFALAQSITDDTGLDVERLFSDALAEPLDTDRADQLLVRVIDVLLVNAERRGDTRTASALKTGSGHLLQKAHIARAHLAQRTP